MTAEGCMDKAEVLCRCTAQLCTALALRCSCTWQQPFFTDLCVKTNFTHSHCAGSAAQTVCEGGEGVPRSEAEGPSKLHTMLCCLEYVQHWALWHHPSQNQELCLGYHPATHKTFPFGASTVGSQQQSPYPSRVLGEGDGAIAP